MKALTLHADTRTITGKKLKKSRAAGLLPAVVYGHGQDTTPLFINAKEFKEVYDEAGTSALVDLTIDQEKAVKVLIHQPQPHYLTSLPVHADFYAVKMTEKIETAIPIHFVGVSPAVEDLEGNLVENKDEIEIRCFPGDLIPFVEADLGLLKTFDDNIRISDLSLPETIEVMHEPDEVIASVIAPISEEELEAELAEDTTAEAAAVEELGKEGDEPAEGEAATDQAEDK